MTGIISFHWKYSIFLQDSAKIFSARRTRDWIRESALYSDHTALFILIHVIIQNKPDVLTPHSIL